MVRHGVQQLLLVLLSIALATAAAAPSEPQVSYEGYQVFRIPIVNVENAHRLLDMVERLGVHLWRAPSRLDNAADVGVPLGLAAAFHRETADFGEPMVMHENLATLLLEEGPLLSYDANSSSSWYEAYHPWADHMKWLKDLSGKYASRSAIYNLGESGEKREMTGIHIWGQAKGKPAVVFFGTSHGREWIVAKSIEWIAEQLLAQYESNAKVKAVMDKYDVYIVPVVNPDGFVYTQEKERMWRKNRTKHATNKCMGVDNNRNWPLGWGEKGSSKDPCSETFAGPSAVSEVENKNMIAFLEKVAREQKVKLFVDWHSYAQLVMSRYGYNCDKKPARDAELMGLAKSAAEAFGKAKGAQYKGGRACEILYVTSGGSTDFVLEKIGAEYSYTLELRDKGQKGFILPPSEIRPSAEESFAGALHMMENVK